MNVFRRALKSLGGGVVVTLVTGLINNTPLGFVGSNGFGLPVVWLRRLVISPVYNPWRFIATGFVADVIIWFIVIWLIIWVGMLITHSHKKVAKKSSAKKKR